MSSVATDPIAVWRAVTQAGSIAAFVDARLREKGFLVERRETNKMSARELEAYKKSLKAEAEEKRKLRREAWRAYKANHIVHLGEGVFWTDKPPADTEAKAGPGKGAPKDKWDLSDAEERAAENELPPIDSPQQLAQALGLTVGQLRAGSPTTGRRRGASTTGGSWCPSATARPGPSGRRCRS